MSRHILPPIPELSPVQRDFYEKTMEHCRSEVSDINAALEAEQERYQQVAQLLMNQKMNLLNMYASACEMVGKENDMAAEMAAMQAD